MVCAMNYPDDIAELELLLELVLGMVEQDENAVARSDRPDVELVFLSSTKKLRTDLRNRLRNARQSECYGRQRMPA